MPGPGTFAGRAQNPEEKVCPQKEAMRSCGAIKEADRLSGAQSVPGASPVPTILKAVGDIPVSHHCDILVCRGLRAHFPCRGPKNLLWYLSFSVSLLGGYCKVQGFVLIRQHGSNLLSALPLACAQQDFAEIVKAWVPMTQVHQKLLCLGPC